MNKRCTASPVAGQPLTLHDVLAALTDCQADCAHDLDTPVDCRAFEDHGFLLEIYAPLADRPAPGCRDPERLSLSPARS